MSKCVSIQCHVPHPCPFLATCTENKITYLDKMKIFQYGSIEFYQECRRKIWNEIMSFTLNYVCIKVLRVSLEKKYRINVWENKQQKKQEVDRGISKIV